MVSAAGNHIPVFVSPVVVIAGAAAVPAANVATPVIVGLVSDLFVSVSVVSLPTKVSVAAGSVKVVVPATAVAVTVVVPDVVPARTSVPEPSVEVAIIFL
jgi:hypothetical protein